MGKQSSVQLTTMIQLKVKGIPINIPRATLAVIIKNEDGNRIIAHSAEENVDIILTTQVVTRESHYTVAEISTLDYLEKGDVVYINTNGMINTLFRKKSIHNSLFVTDRCNSNCLMCSQPPRNIDDLDHFFKINSNLINYIPKSTAELGITGGEPTLMGRRFVTLLEQLTSELPETDIHILTNGRCFAWKNIPHVLGKINNNRIVYGIPLYSDFNQLHDYIVQAKDAFNQTLLGFHNMARNNLRLELRIVLHKQSYKRLPKLAKFIYMNLPFVEHIAFMGLEYTGYTVKNNDVLWIEPCEYENELGEAVLFLDSMDMNVSIYNLPLCLLKPSLWKFTRNSISDWKQKYLEECTKCNLLDQCGGLFDTSRRHSSYIKALT